MNEDDLEALQNMLEERIKQITDNLLASGEAVTPAAVDAWERAMIKALAEYHQAAAVIAGQSLADAQEDAYKQLSATIGLQLGYLRDFANQMRQSASDGQLGIAVESPAAGYQSPAQIAARAQMYAGALRGTYFAAATYGLPLPAMPCEGTLCHSNCKCSWEIIEIDDAAGDYDAYWRRGAKDSCQTCRIRESEWSPVRIRGGILEI
jgi:hypothetical protein